MIDSKIHLLALLASLTLAGAACAVGATDTGAGTDVPAQDDDASAAPPPLSDTSSDAAPAGNDAGLPSQGGSGKDAAGGGAKDAQPPPQSAADAQAATCPGYAPPTTSAQCSACGTTHPCQANGCYGGYYCELSVTKCVPKPSSCP